MKEGTRVYWYAIPERWRRAEDGEPKKYSGTIAVEPVMRDGQWTCLVATDSTGKIVEMNPRKLYVFTREIAF